MFLLKDNNLFFDSEYIVLNNDNNIKDIIQLYKYFNRKHITIQKSYLPNAFYDNILSKTQHNKIGKYVLYSFFLKWLFRMFYLQSISCIHKIKHVFNYTLITIVTTPFYIKSYISSLYSKTIDFFTYKKRNILKNNINVNSINQTNIIESVIKNELQIEGTVTNTINNENYKYNSYKITEKEDVNDWDPVYYDALIKNKNDTTGICMLPDKHRSKIVYNQYIPIFFNESEQNNYDINMKYMYMLIRYNIKGNTKSLYTLIPYDLYMSINNLSYIGLDYIEISDAILFPENSVKMIHNILQTYEDKNIDFYEHIKLTYDIRKMICDKPDYGRNIRYVLDFMYNVYSFNQNNKQENSSCISLTEVYEDFEKYSTMNFCFEICRDIPPEKFIAIAKYNGFHIKDGKLYDRKKICNFSVYKRTYDIAPLILHMHEKIRFNTSYRTKRNLQFRSEPNVFYKVKTPWNIPSNASIICTNNDYGIHELD